MLLLLLLLLHQAAAPVLLLLLLLLLLLPVAASPVLVLHLRSMAPLLLCTPPACAPAASLQASQKAVQRLGTEH